MQEPPARVNILGVGVSAITLSRAVSILEEWIAGSTPHYVCVTGAHGVMESQRDPDLRRIHNEAGLVTPDGMPLVWISHLKGHTRVRRVYGPDLMLTFCEVSERKGYRHFFYGGGAGVAERLASRLKQRFPRLVIAGTFCPPFRPLLPAEDNDIVQRINDARPDIVWVGLSTPKQERWMRAHLGRLTAPVLVGVGAAFDFNAGLKAQAPRWMQRTGLEWLFRLITEPRRLWRRYLLNNPRFVFLVLLQMLGFRRYAMADPAIPERLQGGTGVEPSAVGFGPVFDSFPQDLTAFPLARLSWLQKGFLAVLDQALFAGTNFGVNILLARWISPADYGAFAVAFSVLLLVGAVHTASVTEPMMVFGPGKYSSGFQSYLKFLLRGHFVMMLPAAALLAFAGGVAIHLGAAQVGDALVGAGAASPFILLFWLARRALYVRLHPGWSVVGSTLYLAVTLSTVLALRRAGCLSPATALVGMGCGALAVGVFLLALLRRGADARPGGPSPRDVAIEHWRYGRWSLATVVANWVPDNIYYLILPAWLGLGDAGSLRALLNLALPVLHTISAFSMLLMPTLVLDLRTGGRAKMNGTMRSYLVLLFTGSLVYLLVLLKWNAVLLRVLYGDKYAAFNLPTVFLVGLLPFCVAATVIVGNALRALEKPDKIFWCYVAATGTAIIPGIPLALGLGVSGAVCGLFLSSATTSIVMFWLYRKLPCGPEG